jgi:hypothetical protein
LTVSTAGRPALATERDAGPDSVPDRTGERPTLLRDHLARHHDAALFEPYVGTFTGTLGLVGVVGSIGFADRDPTAEKWRYAGASSIAIVGGFGSYLLPEDYQAPAAFASVQFAAGAWFFAIEQASHSEPAAEFAYATTGAAACVDGGLVIIDMIVERPVSERRLARHHAELARGDASAEQIAEAERDFRRTNRPIPTWVYATPYFAAGLSSAVRAFQPGETDRERARALAMVGIDVVVLGGPYIISLFQKGSYDAYLREQQSVRIAPGGPGGSLGATIVGRF